MGSQATHQGLGRVDGGFFHAGVLVSKAGQHHGHQNHDVGLKQSAQDVAQNLHRNESALSGAGPRLAPGGVLDGLDDVILPQRGKPAASQKARQAKCSALLLHIGHPRLLQQLRHALLHKLPQVRLQHGQRGSRAQALAHRPLNGLGGGVQGSHQAVHHGKHIFGTGAERGDAAHPNHHRTGEVVQLFLLEVARRGVQVPTDHGEDIRVVLRGVRTDQQLACGDDLGADLILGVGQGLGAQVVEDRRQVSRPKQRAARGDHCDEAQPLLRDGGGTAPREQRGVVLQGGVQDGGGGVGELLQQLRQGGGGRAPQDFLRGEHVGQQL
eukprot:RCo006611